MISRSGGPILIGLYLVNNLSILEDEESQCVAKNSSYEEANIKGHSRMHEQINEADTKEIEIGFTKTSMKKTGSYFKGRLIKK